MGLEHPILAVVSVMAVLMILVSMLMVELRINYMLEKVPRLERYARAEWVNDTLVVKVYVRLLRGESIVLEKLVLRTDKGYVVINSSETTAWNSTITVDGIGEAILPGQEKTVEIKISNADNLYTENKTYPLVLVYDKATLTAWFNT